MRCTLTTAPPGSRTPGSRRLRGAPSPRFDRRICSRTDHLSGWKTLKTGFVLTLSAFATFWTPLLGAALRDGEASQQEETYGGRPRQVIGESIDGDVDKHRATP